MSLTIRKIEKDDYNEVEVLTREAFGIYIDRGAANIQYYIIYIKIINQQKNLELVVECEGKIVGHIIYSKGNIDKSKDETFITFGPVSVHPNSKERNRKQTYQNIYAKGSEIRIQCCFYNWR